MSEIGVKLTGDNIEYRSMLDRSIAEGGEFAGKLTTKVGDKLLGLRDVSHAVATALGLNLENIAEQTASLYTGLSEKSRESLKRLGEISTEIADKNIAAMRARLTLEDQYKLALQEQETLRKKLGAAVEAENDQISNWRIALIQGISPLAAILALVQRRSETEKSLADQVEIETAQLKNAAEIERLRAEDKKKQLEISEILFNYAKNEREHAAKTAGYDAERALLANTLLDAKEKLARAEAGSIEQGKSLLEVQKAEFALADKIQQHAEAGRLSANQQEEQALLLAKSKHELTTSEVDAAQNLARFIVEQNQNSAHLNGQEQARLNILNLQTEEKKNQRDIDELLKKGVENLSDAELRKIEVLKNENKEFEIQILAQNALIDGAKERVVVEKKISTEIQAQLDKMNSLETHLSSLIGRIRGGQDFAGASDEVLKELARRDQSVIRTAQNDPLYNSVTGGLGPAYTIANASLDLQSINSELALRKSLRGVDYNTALRNYQGDPLHFDQLYNSAQQTSDGITELNTRLDNSGIFPLNGPRG